MESDFLEKDKNNFTKEDLQFGDIVTLRNGNVLAYGEDGEFYDLSEAYDNWLARKADLTYDLKVAGKKDSDIVKVVRPCKIMFERKEEVKEMTLAQVCEELGYNVKIIKEDK